MVPQQIAEALLVELGNAHAVRIRRDVLCHDVHGQLCEIQVRADARRGGDAGLGQHFAHQLHGQLVGRQLIERQVARHIHEDLVNGIGVDVLRGHIAQIDFVDLLRHLQIPGHPGRRNDVIQPEGGVRIQAGGIRRRRQKVVTAISRRTARRWRMAACSRWAFTSFVRWTTSNSRARPGMR